jgi:PucR C-terminal helix-turn-helix domain
LGGAYYGSLVTLSDTPSPEGERGADVTTIHHLVDAVGSPVLQVLAAPRGLDLRVRSTVLHDAVDELGFEPDAVLLMAGLRADSIAAIELMGKAGECGYCAVVVKRRGAEISSLVTEASINGIAVLAAADEVSWRHLDALLQSVLGSQGVGGDSASGAGDELFALTNAIAAVIGGSVAIEDMDRRVLAYSSQTDQRIDSLREQGILDRHVPDMERNLSQYRAVLAADGVVRFSEKTDEFARSAVAIKAGTQPLGTIWAIEGIVGLSSDGERALLDGARLAALHMLRGLNATDLELHARESALRAALDGSLEPHDVAFRLSLPGGADLTLVGFAATADADGTTPLITHVSAALARYVAAYRPEAAVATTARAVYILVPGSDDASATRFANGALAATHTGFGQRVRAAISYSSSDPAALPTMRRDVDDILRVTLAAPTLPAVARLIDVHTRVLLAHVNDELAREPRLRHPGVVSLLAYDRDHATDYRSSVVAWLDAVGDIASAADHLGVHPNTLRYRLRRVDELFDLALDHPDDRLSIWLQLRASAR